MARRKLYVWDVQTYLGASQWWTWSRYATQRQAYRVAAYLRTHGRKVRVLRLDAVTPGLPVAAQQS